MPNWDKLPVLGVHRRPQVQICRLVQRHWGHSFRTSLRKRIHEMAVAGVDQVRILTQSLLQLVELDDCVVGDVNRDGVVDFLDIGPFIALLNS